MSTFLDNWLLRRAMSAPRGGGGKYIQFADPAVEAICVANWSSDGIGVTYEDAAAVTNLGSVFQNNTSIMSFNELQYFTGLTTIPGNAFYGCTSLADVTIPQNVNTLSYGCFHTQGSIENFVLLPTAVPSGTTNQIFGYSTPFGNLKIYVPYSADHSIINAYKSSAAYFYYSSVVFELNPDGTIPS